MADQLTYTGWCGIMELLFLHLTEEESWCLLVGEENLGDSISTNLVWLAEFKKTPKIIVKPSLLLFFSRTFFTPFGLPWAKCFVLNAVKS